MTPEELQHCNDEYLKTLLSMCIRYNWHGQLSDTIRTVKDEMDRRQGRPPDWKKEGF